jgi:hypothetical protein
MLALLSYSVVVLRPYSEESKGSYTLVNNSEINQASIENNLRLQLCMLGLLEQS